MDANLRQQTPSSSPQFWHKAQGITNLKPSEAAGKDMKLSLIQDICDKKHDTAGIKGKRENHFKIMTSMHMHAYARTHTGETASHVLRIRAKIL